MNVSPERLSPKSRRLLSDPGTTRMLSSASIWEIAIKFQLGKLALPAPPREYVQSRLVLTQTRPLPIEMSHALRVAELPLHHRDPFDRMLIAQVMVEGLPIITSDPKFREYDVEVIAA